MWQAQGADGARRLARILKGFKVPVHNVHALAAGLKNEKAGADPTNVSLTHEGLFELRHHAWDTEGLESYSAAVLRTLRQHSLAMLEPAGPRLK